MGWFSWLAQPAGFPVGVPGWFNLWVFLANSFKACLWATNIKQKDTNWDVFLISGGFGRSWGPFGHRGTRRSGEQRLAVTTRAASGTPHA